MKAIKGGAQSASKQLTADELSKIQELNADFTRAKIALGDIELNKQAILAKIDIIKAEFAQNEQALVAKYGADAVINIQTGEVTEKKD
jgi:hypothetical protein